MNLFISALTVCLTFGPQFSQATTAKTVNLNLTSIACKQNLSPRQAKNSAASTPFQKMTRAIQQLPSKDDILKQLSLAPGQDFEGDILRIRLPSSFANSFASELLEKLLTKEFELPYGGGQKGVLGLRIQKDSEGHYGQFHKDVGVGPKEVVDHLFRQDLLGVFLLGEWTHNIVSALSPNKKLFLKKGQFRWKGSPADGDHTDDSAWTVSWIPKGPTMVVIGEKEELITNDEIVFFRGKSVFHRGLQGERLAYTFFFYPAEDSAL